MAVTREIVRLEVEGAEKAERDIRGVSKALGAAKTALALIAPAAATATASMAAFNAALEVGTAGAKIRDLEQAVTRLGTTAQDVDRLRAAVAGTVTDADLLRFNNMARTLGLNQQQFQKATEVAKAAAGTLGIDVRFAVESVATGLARQSKLWLDNLGIVIDTEKAYKDYAASIGTTASALDDAQKKQAFFNAFVEAGNKLISQAPADRYADQFERVAAELGNVSDAAAKLASVALGRAIDALDDFSGASERARLRGDEVARSLDRTGEAAREAFKEWQRTARFVQGGGHVASNQAATLIERDRDRFVEAARQFASAAQDSAKRTAQPFINAANAISGAFDRTFSRITRGARSALTPDNLPAFIQQFGRGTADGTTRRPTRIRRPEREQFDIGRALQDRAREQAAQQIRDAERADAARIERGRALQDFAREQAQREFEQRQKEAAAAAEAAQNTRDAQLASIAMLDANAAAWARMASAAESSAAIVSGVAVPAVGQVTSALGQAAVSALFAGESFTAALGTGIVQAGQQLMAQAISGLALAGIFSFIPWLAPFAGPLASASAIGLAVGTGLVGVGAGLGGEVRASLPSAPGAGGGGGGRVTGGDIEFERAVRRGSGAPLSGSRRPAPINVFLHGEAVDRGINRSARRGSRYDATRRALPA